jgi:peptidoglycan/xylan/chitin deacetylase (PgdA/CDA1 family)
LDQLGNQLDLMETALLKILGVKPALFRPPYGSINDDITAYLNSRGYTVVGWSGDAGDSENIPLDQQVANLNAATEGSILLAHETDASTVEQVIPATIPGLVQKGLKLIPLNQCLDVQAYQSAPVAYGERDETWTCTGTPAPGSGEF